MPYNQGNGAIRLHVVTRPRQCLGLRNTIGDRCAGGRHSPLLRAEATRLPIILIFVLVTE